MKTCFYTLILLMCTSVALAQSTSERKEGTRQIHLDFHTSEQIEGIGKSFSKEQFKEALRKGNVNSINIFAKGHHGWSYYPTKVGKQHPHLDFDLMGQQIEACKELGVRVHAYFTVGWSVQDANEHPEWIVKTKEGKSVFDYPEVLASLDPEKDPLPETFWEILAPTKTYKEVILEQIKEICENYKDLDGIWFDILMAYPNYGEENMRLMKADGIDVKDEQAVLDYSMNQMKEFTEACNELILSYNPDASIFYNGLTNMARRYNYVYDLYEANTKQDLEDLPTTWGGYDKFPYRAKYFAPQGKELVAMSGKFHSAWGEFGGFKHKDAIMYEAAAMVAFGANVNFGDQLQPSGEMDMSTYENIGYAFDYVKKIEDYGIGGEHVATLGMWAPIEIDLESTEGTAKLLLERQVDFWVVNNLEDWSGLEVIVLPSASKFTPTDVKKIKDFVANGGKLILMGEAALDENGKLLFDVGGEYLGKANYDKDYTVVEKTIGDEIVSSPFLNYIPALRFKPDVETNVLAKIKEPFFSRTAAHYSSHRNTPYRTEFAEHPSIMQKGNVIYIAHPLDKIYFQWGSRIHRDIFYNVLQLLHSTPVLTADLPSAGRVNLLHQPEEKRYVAHLLYAPAHQRGAAQVIEDLIPIHNTEVRVKLPQPVKKVYTVPGKEELLFKTEMGETVITVPEFTMHVGVVFEY